MVDSYHATDNNGSAPYPPSNQFQVKDDGLTSGRKCWLLTIFMLCLSLTCGPLLNGNGVRAMWRRAGIPCIAGSCTHTARLTGSNTTSSDDDKLKQSQDRAVVDKLTTESNIAGVDNKNDDKDVVDVDNKNDNIDIASGQRELSSSDKKVEGVAGDEQQDVAVSENDKQDVAVSENDKQDVAVSMLQVVEEVAKDKSLATEPIAKEEVCPAAEHEMQKWLKMNQSSEMIFAFVGFMLDYAGPKLTFATGQGLLFVSIGMMGMGHNWWAMLVSGATTPLILNSCMCIGNIFLSSRNLVMAMLSGSSDLAQFLFPVAHAIGSVFPSFDYYYFLVFWGVSALLACVSGLIWLPMKPFADTSCEENSDGSPENKALLSLNSSSLGEIAVPEVELPLWKASVTSQIASMPFLLFTLIWMQMAIRLNSFLDSNEDVLREFGDDGSMGSAFGYILPMSFIPCVLVGVLTDKIGVVHAVSVVNVMAIIVNFLSLIPVLPLQWATIVFFLFFKCALFSILFSFVAEVFGFGNFGTLTALVSLVGGAGNILVGSAAIKWVTALGSWFWPNVMFLAMGIAAQFAIFYLVWRPPVPPKHTKEVEKVLHRKRLTHVSQWVGSSRASVSPYLHGEQRSLSKLSSHGGSPRSFKHHV